MHCGSPLCRYHCILQCAVGLLTACYCVTILYCSVQWVCWRRVTVLPYYTAVYSRSADGVLLCYHFMLASVHWVFWRRVTLLPFYVSECSLGLLTACYHFMLPSVQWVCLRRVTVLPYYTAVCTGSADGVLPFHIWRFCLRSDRRQVTVIINKNWRHLLFT